MRTVTMLTLMLTVLFTMVTGCGRQSAPVQAPLAADLPKAARGSTLTGELPGNAAALKAILARQSAVSFQVITVSEPVLNRDTYLDSLLAQRKWPEPSMFVVVVFQQDGFDLRFAMGADFSQRQVAVNEVLDMARSLYFPKARAGDPAGGLADLLQAIIRRME